MVYLFLTKNDFYWFCFLLKQRFSRKFHFFWNMLFSIFPFYSKVTTLQASADRGWKEGILIFFDLRKFSINSCFNLMKILYRLFTSKEIRMHVIRLNKIRLFRKRIIFIKRGNFEMWVQVFVGINKCDVFSVSVHIQNGSKAFFLKIKKYFFSLLK